MNRARDIRRGLAVAVLAGVVLWSAGCGYFKNVRDDMMDIGTVSIGISPPVMPGEKGKALGFLPHCIGVYVEATDFLHLGALLKRGVDAEWDRRGAGIIEDTRAKFGFGPWHYVRIDQQPITANAYKEEGNELDGWREYMRDLNDPFFDAPAKELIFKYQKEGVPYPYKGWQDWEMFSAEVAIPEPFITHSGLYVRVGFDVSQVFDAVLSLVGIDLYADRAYNMDGSLRFGGEQRPKTAKAGTIERFFGE